MRFSNLSSESNRLMVNWNFSMHMYDIRFMVIISLPQHKITRYHSEGEKHSCTTCSLSIAACKVFFYNAIHTILLRSEYPYYVCFHLWRHMSWLILTQQTTALTWVIKIKNSSPDYPVLLIYVHKIIKGDILFEIAIISSGQ